MSGLTGNRRMPNEHIKRVDKREDKPKSKSKCRVHALAQTQQLEMFDRKPKRYTLCKRKVDAATLVTSEIDEITCKRCLKKICTL